MKRIEIDKVYKNGLLEWEKINDTSADLAKERVWHAINRSKQKRRVHWAFISSAAALLLLLVSGFLFLKLENKQKELLALQEQMDSKTTASIKPKVDNLVNDEPEKKPVEIQKEEETELIETPIEDLDTKPSLDLVDNLAVIMADEFQDIKPIQESKIEVSVPNLVLETTVFPSELPKTALIFPEQKMVEELPQTHSMAKAKIKFGLGKGQQSQNPQNTLALNIKL